MPDALAAVVQANCRIVARLGFLGPRDHLLDHWAYRLGFGKGSFDATVVYERGAQIGDQRFAVLLLYAQ